jgi:transcriptional regulator with XRE-family HTH domain
LKKKEENNQEVFCINNYKKNDKYFNHLLTVQNIGKAIKEARLKRKLTLKDLAKYLDMPTSTLSRVENNATDVKLSTILKIIDRLNAKIFFQIELQHFWKDFNAQKLRDLKANKKKQ